MKRRNRHILPWFALKRPTTVVMMLIALLVVGYIAFSKIAVELLPAGFTPPFLGVWTPYPNSTPKEVEELIARPIEESIRTVSGVRRIRTSSSAGGCWTFVQFSQGTDMDLAYAQLRDRMERVRAELPDDVERIYLRKWSEDDDPILWLTLTQTRPHDDPYMLVEQHVKKPLERIDGVAKVEIWGAEEKSILIHINQDRVKSYKVNLYEVIQRLRGDNFAISSGYVKEGGRKIYVRSLGKFQSLDEIRNLPIRGANLRLKDIAEVKYDVPERRWRMKVDGHDAISIGIYKESMANTVELCDRVQAVLRERIEKDPRLAIFKMNVLFDQGQFIKESIDNLTNTAYWGGLFAFLVLYFFLRRFRMTLIVTLPISLSVLITITVMYFIGWSLNVVTMMGLMISIGMVVDNSIVVIENIYRRMSSGDAPHKAALEGTSEVAMAITLATLTTVVVFLPLILMNDEIGFRFYMLRIGLPVILSLLASLLVAMVLIPLAATRIKSRKPVQEHGIIRKSNALYGRMLNWSLHHRTETFVILLLVLASMMFASQRVKHADNTSGNINDIRLFFEMPDNFSLDEAEKVLLAVEDTVRSKADLYGLKTINLRYSHNWGQMRIFLHPPEKRDWYEVLFENLRKKWAPPQNARMTRNEVVEDLKKRLPKFPGVEIRVGWGQSGSSETSVAILLYGDDTGTLVTLAEEVERRLRSIPDILSVETDRDRGQDEIHLIIHREQAHKYGISPRLISGTVQYALRGIPLPRLHTSEKEIEVRIQLREQDRRNLLQLQNMTFFTRSGKEIPLSAVASFKVEKGLGQIIRRDGKTHLQVKAYTTTDDLKRLYERIDRVMAGFTMPVGYSWSKGESFIRMRESDDSQKFALILSATFVFLLMGVLFESFVLPLSVILSIPFAFVGSFWLMYVTGTAIDIMSQIGFVILVGIVVNNAIVLIDFINRLRQEGLSRTEAILQAGKHRFRPILMTAFTTIGGLIPMALGGAQMIGIPYSPMGRTIIGGLLTSTLLSLIAVPWAYTLFDDMRNYFKKLTVMYLTPSPSESAAELPEPEQS